MSKPQDRERRAAQKTAPRRPKQPFMKKHEDPSELVMLINGKNTNFPKWKEKMRNKIALEFGELIANIIDNGEALDPAMVDAEDFDLENEVPAVADIELYKYKLALSSRQKLMSKQEELMPKCAALFWMYLSRESMEAVRRHEDFDEALHRNDPVQLYKSILATHPVGGGALDAASRRISARQVYRSTRQGPMESIADYKIRFTFNKEAYDSAGNVELPDLDVAMDFFTGLDNTRYAKFKADLENDRSKGIAVPQTLNDMYHRASCFVVVRSNNWKPRGGAVFTTCADDYEEYERTGGAGRGRGRGGRRGSGPRGAGRGGRGDDSRGERKSAAGASDGKHKPQRNVICYNCNEEGHISRNCPNALSVESDSGTVCATFGAVCIMPTMSDTRTVLIDNTHTPFDGSDTAEHVLVSDIESDSYADDDVPPDLVSDTDDESVCADTNNVGVQLLPCEQHVYVGCEKKGQHGRAHATLNKLAWYEVLLDNQADISVVHPRLLTGIRPQKSYVSGLSGMATLPYVGKLDGFFECKSSDKLIASVLCMADVEDMYDVTYARGESYTVHMDDRDLVFHRRDKLYVADMREWESYEYEPMVMVTTAAENEANYTSKEIKRAKQARELVVNAGYSSEREAVKLAGDGNITGVPITGRDIKRSFDIYGKPTAYVRGRRTAQKAKTQRVDEDLKSPHGEAQTMYGDVVYFREKPYLMCLSTPLHLITSTELVNTKTETIGEALHKHIGTLQSRGFQPTIVHLDAQSGFTSLESNIQGVEVDVGGAGDHTLPLDVEVRHIKEIYRSVLAGLPWVQPKKLDGDLLTYCVSRKNLRSTPNSVESARVKFTGRKPDYRKELGIAYGDYCECFKDRSSTAKSKNVDVERTEPCIALYPTGNANGSWMFFNMTTKKRVRRTNWQKMVTADIVIEYMNLMTELDEEIGDEDPGGDEEVAEEVGANEAPADDDAPLEQMDEDSDSESEHSSEGGADEGDEDEVVEPVGENGPQSDHSPEDAVPENQPSHRRSARLEAGARRPMRYRSFHTSVKKGLQEHGADAYKAIVAELKQLLQEKKALVPVLRSDLSARQLKRVIRSLMFLKTKFDGLGRFEKIKARLVANGKQQDRSLYPDTYSPTVALQSVLMCLTVAAKENRKVCAIDIGGAYLNAERVCEEGEEIIMELEPVLVNILKKIQPEVEPFIDEKGRVLVKLNKAMYGTLDAAKIWYEKLTGVLRDMGFVPNKVDPCVMNKTIKGKQCTILVYVDDLLVTCVEEEAISEVIQQLEDAFEGDVKKNLDKDLSYLGMHLKIERGRITISMASYLKGLLDELVVTGTVTTPATVNLFMVNKGSPKLSPIQAKKFHTVVAKLLYLAKRARVDVLLAVAFLSTRVKSPTMEDQTKLERLLKYLNGTKSQVFVLQPSGDVAVGGYIDASFGCHSDGKSHSGLVVTLYGCIVLCMSSKQKIVTRDSTEAELVALSDKLMNVVQCFDFMRHQGVNCDIPQIYQDNTSTITLVTKGGGKYRTKYMRVRQGFVQERYAAGEVAIVYMPTGRMLADALTKALQGAVFRFLTRRITGQQ